jgi:hypothetical protein
MGHAKALSSREKVKSDRPAISTWHIILILVVVALSLFYVRFKVEGLRIGYDISRNNKAASELLREKRILQSELMMAKSPDKLEVVALELGFKYPTQEDTIYINDNKVLMEDKTVVSGKE